MVAKKKIIVDYKNVPDDVLQMLAEKYPHGYKKDIIKFKNAKGEMVSAVPIDTDEVSYLVKVSVQLQTMVDNFDLDEEDDMPSDDIGSFDDEIDKENYDDDMDEASDIADTDSYDEEDDDMED